MADIMNLNKCKVIFDGIDEIKEESFNIFRGHIPTTNVEIEELVHKIYTTLQTQELQRKIISKCGIDNINIEIRELYETDRNEEEQEQFISYEIWKSQKDDDKNEIIEQEIPYIIYAFITSNLIQSKNKNINIARRNIADLIIYLINVYYGKGYKLIDNEIRFDPQLHGYKMKLSLNQQTLSQLSDGLFSSWNTAYSVYDIRCNDNINYKDNNTNDIYYDQHFVAQFKIHYILHSYSL